MPNRSDHGLFVAGLVALASLILAGCSHTPQEPELPPGFTDGGSGVAWRVLDSSDADLPCESQYGICAHYQFYAYLPCPGGVQAAVAFRATPDSIGLLDRETLPAMSAGDSVEVVFQARHESDRYASIDYLYCL